MKTIDHSVEVQNGVSPIETADATTAVNGTGVDTLEFDDARLVGQVGAASGTPTTQPVVFKVQESDALASGYTDVSGATFTLSADNAIGDVEIPDFHKVKRYVRAVITPALTGGTSPVIEIGALFELGRKIQEPVD